MTALHIFETERVDIVILEVGMGGRLDATNIVPSTCILVSALTAVDLDHQAFLGNTVSLIAREKSGIAREGKPFVLGRQTHPEVGDVVREIVDRVGGTLISAPHVLALQQDVSSWSLLGNPSAIGPPAKLVQFHSSFFDTAIQARFPLQGNHQLDNLGTALGVVEALLSDCEGFVPTLRLKSRITPTSIVKGIENVKWRGRLSFHGISIPIQPSSTSTSTRAPNLLVLVDGAHNPASAETLGSYISSLLKSTLLSSSASQRGKYCIPITFILSFSHSPCKTPIQTLSPILSSSLYPPVRDFVPSSHSEPIVAFRPSVALLRFTPPEGMPWVRPVPLQLMRDTIRAILPNLAEDALWVAAGCDGAQESEDASNGTGNISLREALKWAANRHAHVSDVSNGLADSEQTIQCPGLVVLAGSLYLVADFYRMLQQERSMADRAFHSNDEQP